MKNESLDQRKTFYELANLALKHKLVTSDEIKTISRPGTRKAGYYGRHVHDLASVMLERIEKIKQEIETCT